MAAEVGLCAHTIGTLCKRFKKCRLAGLSDLPRSGAPRSIEDEKVQAIVEDTLHRLPQGRTHWSSRQMAKAHGVSHESVSRLWKAFGLKPHCTESIQLSKDPYYVEKFRDGVGLYMSPPENALVLCVDEKSQIQALQRSQPIMPLRSGSIERHTPEYFRHGTLSLFAALDVKKGQVLGKCYQRHRTEEFLSFLKQIEKHVSADFRLRPGIDRPIKKNRNQLRSFQAVLVCLPASEKQRLTKEVREAKAAHFSGVRNDLSENKIVVCQAAMRGGPLENKKAKLCAAC